jgi:hypothetical protein
MLPDVVDVVRGTCGELALVGAAGASTTLLELDVDAGELALVDAAGAEEGLLELELDAEEALLELELALVDAGELAAASTTLLELDAGAEEALLELELALVDAGELAAASTTLLELELDAGELARVGAAGAEEGLLKLGDRGRRVNNSKSIAPPWGSGRADRDARDNPCRRLRSTAPRRPDDAHEVIGAGERFPLRRRRRLLRERAHGAPGARGQLARLHVDVESPDENG